MNGDVFACTNNNSIYEHPKTSEDLQPPTIVDIKLIVITIIRLNTREQPQTILTIYQHCLLLAVCQLV